MSFIKVNSRFFAAALWAVFALLIVQNMQAQDVRGTITGKVKDASGAVIPSASIKITDPAKGATTVVTSNEAGYFQAPYLLPGTYQMTVEGRGFKRYVRQNITLRIGETIELGVQLEVGNAEESITITAEIPALDTTSASMGQTVDARRVAELPLVHGDPYTMIGLSPGVTFARDQGLDRPGQ